jgi:hypothetical protein
LVYDQFDRETVAEHEEKKLGENEDLIDVGRRILGPRFDRPGDLTDEVD